MGVIEKLRIRIKVNYDDKIGNKLFAKRRRNKLNNTDFSILCNNCWGGYVYRFFGIPYLSPTVGLYIFPDDFLMLLTDIKGYFSQPLQFITPENSKYFDILKAKAQSHVPIGRLGDIEIIFLHYHSEEEAMKKWKRRVERFNYDNMIIKFSRMNGATRKHLEDFNNLFFTKKLMFVNTDELSKQFKCAIYYMGQENQSELNNDTNFYNNYVNLYELVNSRGFEGKNTVTCKKINSSL